MDFLLQRDGFSLKWERGCEREAGALQKASHRENQKLPVPVYKLTLIAALTINTFYLNANLSFLEKEWLWIRFSTLLWSLFRLLDHYQMFLCLWTSYVQSNELKSNSSAIATWNQKGLQRQTPPATYLCPQSALLQLKPLKLGTRFREFLFVHSSRKCQNRSGNPLPLLPGPGSQLHNKNRGINASVAGRPSPGLRTTEIKDQDKEDAAEATAKRFRSFGLEVSVWPCSHSEKEQPPNSQC